MITIEDLKEKNRILEREIMVLIKTYQKETGLNPLISIELNDNPQNGTLWYDVTATAVI